MSSSTSARARTPILRGSSANQVSLARMDVELRTNPFGDGRFDARLVDPTLARAVEEAAEEARTQGHREGYAAGHAEGLVAARRETEAARAELERQVEAAEAARQESVERAVNALNEAAAGFARRQAVQLGDVETLLLEAAYDLATVLVGRELESVGAPVRDAARRALRMVPDDGPVTLYVHPVDVDTLGGPDELDAGRHVRVVADPDVEPGSCVADAGPTHVDAGLQAALQRVREVLTP